MGAFFLHGERRLGGAEPELENQGVITMGFNLGVGVVREAAQIFRQTGDTAAAVIQIGAVTVEKPSAAVIAVHLRRHADLFQISGALGRLGSFTGLLESREQHGGKNSDDGNVSTLKKLFLSAFFCRSSISEFM